MADKSKDSPKRCFVICPIGERGSEIRARSDDLFNNLIEPVAREAGYIAQRVIDNDRPGDITAKIVGDIIESDAVICDITGHNPNVFYELAIAHAWKKPCVIISGDDPIRVPFDIGSQNVIQILLGSFAGAKAATENLARHLEALSGPGAGQDSPVGRYERGKELQFSGDPMAETVADIQTELSELRALVREREQVTAETAKLLQQELQDNGLRFRWLIPKDRQHRLDVDDDRVCLKKLTGADELSIDTSLFVPKKRPK
ncbi:MAG: hypothetical protein HQL42_18470 [Alphaproteobacteria bacterium]|nr:hypothetical protein [Alphaproteobacteria bacterium]